MEYNWKEYKEKRLLELKNEIESLGYTPTLAIMQVGSLAESNSYVRNKIKACERIGINPIMYNFSEGTSANVLIEMVKALNNDSNINGIFLQLPAPGLTDEESESVIETIDPLKDVDGLTRKNFDALVHKEPSIVPCTPKGVMEMLSILTPTLDGKDIVLIGRSKLVGKPLFHLLEQSNATVTVCHSHTKDLKTKTTNADIIITAVGNHKNLITGDMIKDGAIVIDVAISRDEEKQIWYGDCDYESVSKKASYVTPVPGGVGQLTVLELMDNVVRATIMQKKITPENNKKTLNK